MRVQGEGLVCHEGTRYPYDVAVRLRAVATKRLIVAGGIAGQEADCLDAIGVDAVVGMAIYTGRLAV